jgi:hypothetical protein
LRDICLGIDQRENFPKGKREWQSSSRDTLTSACRVREALNSVCASCCAEVLWSNWTSPMYTDTCHSQLKFRDLIYKISNAKVTSYPLSEVAFKPSFRPMPASTPLPEGEGKDSKHKERKLIDKQCNSFHQRTAAWTQCRISWFPSPFVLYSQVELCFALKVLFPAPYYYL